MAFLKGLSRFVTRNPLLALLGAGGLGAIGGGLAGSFLDGRRGKGGQVEEMQRFTPEQQAALDQLLQQGMAAIEPGALETRARRQFEEETIPSIAERFTAMGGGQLSSAFPAALGRAGAGLEESLAALRTQMGLQQVGMGLQPRFEPTYFQRQPGFAEAGITALAPQVLKLLPLLLGGRI